MRDEPALVICPIATMLDARENLDVPTVGLMIERLLPHVDGLFVLGSSGETAPLRDDVRCHAVREVVARVGGCVPV